MSEKAKMWQIDKLDNMEFLSARYIDQSFPWHAHDSYCIGIIQEGAEFLEFRNKKYFVPAGSIITINPYVAHKNYAAFRGGWIHRMFYISQDVLKFAAKDKKRSFVSFKKPVQRNAKIFNQLKKIHSYLEKNPYERQIEDKFFTTIRNLIQEYAADEPNLESPRTDDISSIARYLLDHIDHDISIEVLSEKFGLSPFYLIRKFKKEIGLTPHSFLVQARIIKAKELLKKEKPIAQVALNTGFYDQPHFTKSFRQYTGVSPNQFLSNRNFLQ